MVQYASYRAAVALAIAPLIKKRVGVVACVVQAIVKKYIIDLFYSLCHYFSKHDVPPWYDKKFIYLIVQLPSQLIIYIKIG